MKVVSLRHTTDIKALTDYRKQLSCLVIDYYKEVHSDIYNGNLVKAMDVVSYWEESYFTYIVVDDNDSVAGFLVMSTNNQYDMVKPYLIVDYMYVAEAYRGTRATQWLFLTIGKVADTLQMDVLGTTLAGSSNNHNAELTGGEVVATIRLMKREAFKDKYIRYSRRLNVKI